MPVSYAELKAMLDVDEPDYPALAAIAADAMQHLRKLAASDDVSVASKAVSLAGIIGDTSSIGVVSDAARSRHALVRVAAAHAASLFPDGPQAARVVSKLLDDADIGVVKLAARAASRQTAPGIAVKAKRASARMASAVRAAVKENTQRERVTVMAMKARKKAGGRAAQGKAAKRAAAAGQMPTGAMTEPPKGAKARAMPAGKMN
jgi:hypothetical protein